QYTIGDSVALGEIWHKFRQINLKLDFSQLYVGFHYQLFTCHSIAYWRRIGELRATFAWMWLCVPWFFAQPASAASISPPVLVQDPQPPLPPDATLGFIGRDVPLRLVVEEDGSVGEVSLLEPQGDLIDAVALSSAWKLSFRPALHDGVATRARITFLIRVGPAPGPIVERGDGGLNSASTKISVDALPASETTQETEVTITGTRVPER